MSYGTASPHTRAVLTAVGLGDVELEQGDHRVDIVAYGAVDEQFSVPAERSHDVAFELARDLAASIIADWSVEVYDDTAEPPEPVQFYYRASFNPEG